MTAKEIVEFHLKIEERHLKHISDNLDNSDFTLAYITQQTNIVKKLKQILKEIKEQENEFIEKEI